MHESRATVEALVGEIDALRGAHPVRRLNGGEVSSSWLLRREDEAFVLRIDEPLAAALGLDRQSEIEALKLVGNAGVGPRLIWADPARGIQVCSYIEGPAWSGEDAHEPILLTELARTLATLHQLPPKGAPFDPVGAARRYVDSIATQEAADQAGRARQLVAELDTGAGRTSLCHNDLVHGNLVGHGPVRLIDWEYAAVGDPCFDLAIVIRHHELPDSLVKHFLNEYSRNAPGVDPQRLSCFYELYDLLSALWYQSMAKRFGAASAFQAEWDRVRVRATESAGNRSVHGKT